MTVRAAPDVMALVSALLPVKDGVAVWAVLSREADQRRRQTGDPRSRDQIMADTLVAARLLNPGRGRRHFPVSLMINVAVSDSALLGDDDGSGWVEHYGPVPGDLLREWIAANAEAGVDQWVRRLYVSPETGELVAMDSRARLFDGRGGEFLRLRDQRCRTPYCDAPIRHLDHAEDHARGGPTRRRQRTGSLRSLQLRQAGDGLDRSGSVPGPRHVVETVTPTGHAYTSTAPGTWSVVERGLRNPAGLRTDGLTSSVWGDQSQENQVKIVAGGVDVEVERCVRVSSRRGRCLHR